MGYLRKHLHQGRLLSTLLFVGVLGGLLAPLPSEALPPTVKLKVDTGGEFSILSTTNTSSTCTSTEQTLGYTHCYAINTNLTVAGAGAAVNRSYNVRNAPGATARLRVADTAGQNKLSLIGVQFVPAPLAGQSVANWGNVSPTFANTNEIHKLTITTFNVYNAPVNTGNAGTQAIALRAGGEFRAGPTTSGACAGSITTGLCNNVGNSVTFPGTGTFSTGGPLVNILRPSGANSQPLSLTVGGPTAAIVSFNGLTNTTLGQVNPTYPMFLCDSNGATAGGVCTPSITQIMTVTLKGPDSFVLVNGGDTFCADCTATLSAKEQKKIAFLTKLVEFLNWLERRHPNPRLSAFIDRIEAFLAVVNSGQNDPENLDCPGATLVNLDVATAAAADQVAFMADGAVDVEPAPPDPETGTIRIIKNTTTGGAGGRFGSGTFNFHIANGPSPDPNPEITVDSDSSCCGTAEVSVSVNAGTYNVSEVAQGGNWSLDSNTCDDDDGEGGTFVNVSQGETVTCTFNNVFFVPFTGTGTIQFFKKIDSGNGVGTQPTFNFLGSGEGITTNFSLTIPALPDPQQEVKIFSGLRTGAAGGSRDITETSLPSNWELRSAGCGVRLDPPNNQWDPLFSGTTLIGVRVNPLADNATLSCTFINVWIGP